MAQNQVVAASNPYSVSHAFKDLLKNRSWVVFVVWAAWLAIEYLALGPFSYVRIPENADINLPARLTFAHDVATHHLGFWAPQWVSGVDRLAQLMGSGLDALSYIFLPGWMAYGLYMFVQRFVASYFSFRLMRDDLGLDLLPSVYVGLAYSLFSHDIFGGISDSFTLYDGLGLPGIPLILWALGRLDRHGIFRGPLIAAALGMAFAWNSGFPIAIFVFPLIIFWFLLISSRRAIRIWACVAAFIAGWLIGSVPYLWATMANAASSHRAHWNASGNQETWMSYVLLPLKIVRDK